MGGLLLIYLLVEYWYVLLAGVAFFVFVLCLDAYDDRQARRRSEAADRLRHQRARAEIDAITIATARAMRRAAHGHQQLTPGMTLEVRR